MATRRKNFDCIAMKRRGAEKVRRETEGMSREDELAYWTRGTAELLEEQKKRRQEKSQIPPGASR